MSVDLRIFVSLVGALAAAVTGGCTSSPGLEPRDLPAGAGGAGGTAGSAGSGGTGGAGAEGPGGAGTGAAGTPTAGSSGQGGAAGAVLTAGLSSAGLGGASAGRAGEGGVGAAGSGGIASGGIAGSDGGMSGGESAGGTSGIGGLAGSAAVAGQGGADDPRSAASVLDDFRLLDPCDLTTYRVEQSPAAVCPQKNEVKNQHIALTFGGNPTTTYEITLRVRGVFEGYWYEGGTSDPGGAFYVGGLPTVGGFSSACKNRTNQLPFPLPADITPTDDCFNGFNVVAMTVSAPKKQYYLNHTVDVDGDRPPHKVYSFDYTATIPIQGQASLDFYIIGSDEHQCYNHDVVIDGFDLPSSPYIGDFFHFDVTAARVVP